MDLSIIIPIYNTSVDTLNRCVSSIEKIKNINFEILLIDDGSTIYNNDEYRKFSEEHKKTKYIRKINEGVSSARNLGIEKAIGKYIMFIDSDDELVRRKFKVSNNRT